MQDPRKNALSREDRHIANLSFIMCIYGGIFGMRMALFQKVHPQGPHAAKGTPLTFYPISIGIIIHACFASNDHNPSPCHILSRPPDKFFPDIDVHELCTIRNSINAIDSKQFAALTSNILSPKRSLAKLFFKFSSMGILSHSSSISVSASLIGQ